MDQRTHDSSDKAVDESRMETSSLKLEAAATPDRGMPECLRNMTEEQRNELEKRLLRKVDRRLLPMMIIIYIMNYLDRFVGRRTSMVFTLLTDVGMQLEPLGLLDLRKI
jgi:hypothetical protein